MEIFAKRLKEILTQKGQNQMDFAKKLRIPHGTVNSWCLGRNYPTVEMLIIICNELHESADYLLGLKDD